MIIKKFDIKDDDLYQLSVLYSILLGINCAAKTWSENIHHKWGPLDENDTNKIRVYRRPRNTLLTSFECGVYRNRNKAKDDLIDSLDSFVFLDVGDLKLKDGQKVPEGKLVASTCLGNTEGKLRVGIVPLCCRKNFDFELTPVSSKCKKARVVYLPDDEQEPFCEMARLALETAYKHKCNIVIFPEFTCSMKMKKVISDTMKSLKSKYSEAPFLVFAGTNWTSENENVLHVFNQYGEEIGSYYKREKYDHTDDKGYRVFEDLKNPWKNVDFFGIPDIGYIMPVVCMDAIVKDGPADLFSKLFFPLLIVIPSWSESVNSFNRLRANAKDCFTSFIVGDACGAVYGKKTNSVGLGIIVTKDETTVEGHLEIIDRKDCDEEFCKEGCIIILEYDFNFVGGKEKGDDPIINTKIKRI